MSTVVEHLFPPLSVEQERMAKMMPKSEEHKKRISESVKSKWADPEFRQRTRDKMKEAARARLLATGRSPRPPRQKPAVRGERRMSALARSQKNNRLKWERLSRKAEVSPTAWSLLCLCVDG